MVTNDPVNESAVCKIAMAEARIPRGFTLIEMMTVAALSAAGIYLTATLLTSLSLTGTRQTELGIVDDTVRQVQRVLAGPYCDWAIFNSAKTGKATWVAGAGGANISIAINNNLSG